MLTGARSSESAATPPAGSALTSHLHRFTLLPPSWEIPVVGKSRALRRFHRLNEADIDPIQKEAFAIGFIDDGETCSVRIESGRVLNELSF